MNKQEKEELVNQLNSRLMNYPSDPWVRGHNEGLKSAVIVVSNLPTADEPQKVKVPAFVAGWIELCKEKADAASCLNGYYEIGNGTIVRPRGFSEEFYDWLADCGHMDDLARAWLDGYEVEEEQKWVVKSNRLYFTGITQLIARDPITYNFTTDEKRAHVFDDKESAEKEASFFDGTIEKVEV